MSAKQQQQEQQQQQQHEENGFSLALEIPTPIIRHSSKHLHFDSYNLARPQFPPCLVSIEGNIGVGKSTLCNRMVDSYPKMVHTYPEITNPLFLDLFYKDCKKYGFPFQLNMLKMRQVQYYLALRDLTYTPLEQPELRYILCDRSILGDYIFGITNYVNGNISRDEFRVYETELSTGVYGDLSRHVSHTPSSSSLSSSKSKEILTPLSSSIDSISNDDNAPLVTFENIARFLKAYGPNAYIYLDDEPSHCKDRVEKLRCVESEANIPLDYYDLLDALHFSILIFSVAMHSKTPVHVMAWSHGIEQFEPSCVWERLNTTREHMLDDYERFMSIKDFSHYAIKQSSSSLAPSASGRSRLAPSLPPKQFNRSLVMEESPLGVNPNHYNIVCYHTMEHVDAQLAYMREHKFTTPLNQTCRVYFNKNMGSAHEKTTNPLPYDMRLYTNNYRRLVLWYLASGFTVRFYNEEDETLLQDHIRIGDYMTRHTITRTNKRKHDIFAFRTVVPSSGSQEEEKEDNNNNNEESADLMSRSDDSDRPSKKPKWRKLRRKKDTLSVDDDDNHQNVVDNLVEMATPTEPLSNT